MSKITYGQLFDSIPALRELASQPMAFNVSLRLGRLVTCVEGHLKDFTEVQKKMLAKHNIEAGSTPAPDVVAAYNADFDGIKGEEITIDIPTITLDDMADCRMSPANAKTIDWLISEN